MCFGGLVQWHNPIDLGDKLSVCEPMIDVGRRRLLFRCGGFEHSKSMQAAAFDVKGPTGNGGRAVRPAIKTMRPRSAKLPIAKSKSGSRSVSQKTWTPSGANSRIACWVSVCRYSMTRSAPNFRQVWALAGEPAVVMTVAPTAFAICTTIDPTPPEPPAQKSFRLIEGSLHETARDEP